MKEMIQENVENDGATAFDLPNSLNPYGAHPVHYGNQFVPRPTNAKAKITPHAEVMRAVLAGK